MVGFERIGHLVALSTEGLKPEIYESLCVASTSLEVSFDAYVKSQVHLNLTDDLFSRPFRKYVHAMRFLQSQEEYYRKDTSSVLRWFYRDMAYFLIHNRENICLRIEVPDCLELPEVVYYLPEVQEEFRQVTREHSVEAVRKFRFSELLRKIKSRKELQQKSNSCFVAAILLKEATSQTLGRVVLKEE